MCFQDGNSGEGGGGKGKMKGREIPPTLPFCLLIFIRTEEEEEKEGTLMGTATILLFLGGGGEGRGCAEMRKKNFWIGDEGREGGGRRKNSIIGGRGGGELQKMERKQRNWRGRWASRRSKTASELAEDA